MAARFLPLPLTRATPQRNPQDHAARAPNLYPMQTPRTPKPAPGSASAARQRDWALFTGLTFLFSFGFAVYMGVFQNFLRDRLGADALALLIAASGLAILTPPWA
jgi:hypothetical protein